MRTIGSISAVDFHNHNACCRTIIFDCKALALGELVPTPTLPAEVRLMLFPLAKSACLICSSSKVDTQFSLYGASAAALRCAAVCTSAASTTASLSAGMLVMLGSAVIRATSMRRFRQWPGDSGCVQRSLPILEAKLQRKPNLFLVLLLM